MRALPIRAIIIDEDLKFIERLNHLLLDHCPFVEVVGISCNIKNGLKLIEQKDPKIVFMDVDLPLLPGFQLCDLSDTTAFSTIVTGRSDSCSDTHNGSAYLKKPIQVQKLKICLEQAMEELGADSLDQLLISETRQIAVPIQAGLKYLDIDRIVRVEASKNYSMIYLSLQSRPIVVSRKLKKFEKLLSPRGFIRVHNSHLVNSSYIAEFSKREGGYLVLTDDNEILIGPHYRQQVQDVLEQNVLRV